MSTSVAFLKLSDLYCFRSLLFSLNPFWPSLKYFESYKSVLDPLCPYTTSFQNFTFSAYLMLIFTHLPCWSFSNQFQRFYHRWPFQTFQRLFTPFSKTCNQFSSIFIAFSYFSTPFQKLMVFYWFFFDIVWPLFGLLRPPRLPFESCTLHSWTQDSGQREVSNNLVKIGIGWVFDPFLIV